MKKKEEEEEEEKYSLHKPPRTSLSITSTISLKLTENNFKFLFLNKKLG